MTRTRPWRRCPMGAAAVFSLLLGGAATAVDEAVPEEGIEVEEEIEVEAVGVDPAARLGEARGVRHEANVEGVASQERVDT